MTSSFSRILIITVVTFSYLQIGRLYSSANTQTSVSEEYALKAAMIYRFATYVDLPMEKSANKTPLIISVVGDDPFGNLLETVTTGKTFNGLPIQIVRNQSPTQLSRNSIVFISASESTRVTEIMRSISVPGILSISDIPGFAEKGGIIELKLGGDKIRFDVNIDAAKRAGIRISSRLLRLATVRDDTDVINRR